MRPRGRVGDNRPRRRWCHRLVERHRNIGTERFLNRDRMLGREPMRRPIEMAPERHAVLVDDPEVAERHDLESAGVGQDRLVPGHEPVKAAEPGDALVARP
jgi:hypothetical protein